MNSMSCTIIMVDDNSEVMVSQLDANLQSQKSWLCNYCLIHVSSLLLFANL